MKSNLLIFFNINFKISFKYNVTFLTKYTKIYEMLIFLVIKQNY